MISFAYWIFGVALVPVVVSGAIIATGRIAERARPAATCPTGGVLFNLFYLVPYSLLHAVSVPAIAGVAVATTNAFGGGLVRLPSSGWGLVAGVALYTLAMDFGEYVFHRAQHRFPVLWTMHSLHHSDRAVNVSTTQRHFWAEQAIKSATIYLVVGLLFRTNDRIVLIYGVLTFWNYVAHMNLAPGLRPGLVHSELAAVPPSFIIPAGASTTTGTLPVCSPSSMRSSVPPMCRPRGSTPQPAWRTRIRRAAWPRRCCGQCAGGCGGSTRWLVRRGSNDGRPRCPPFRPASSAAADGLGLRTGHRRHDRRHGTVRRGVLGRNRAIGTGARRSILLSGLARRAGRPADRSAHPPGALTLQRLLGPRIRPYSCGVGRRNRSSCFGPFCPSPMSTSSTSRWTSAWPILCCAPSTRTFSTVFSCSPCWPGA